MQLNSPTLNRVRSYLGMQYTRFQFRSTIDEVQSFTEFFSTAQSVLIALPVGYDAANLASEALEQFRQRLSHLQLTVIHNSSRYTSLTEFPKCEVIRLNPLDINKFSLPSKPLLKRVLSREYDVAMDLNFEFVLHTAYICRASRAKVRIGFAHPHADLFYNVQLNTQSAQTPQAMYGRFAACLDMF